MRKLILLFMLSIAVFAVDAQRLLVTDIAKVTQKFTLDGKNVTAISTDTTLASPTNNQLVTAKAVRDYAWKLGGRPVSSTAPSSGQVLKWDGAKWAPAADGGGGGGDNWGTQVVETDASLAGDGTAGDPLRWDGNFVSLPITGTGLSGAPLDVLANSIDTSHIATNGVGPDEIRPGAVGSSELAQQGATTGQVLKWNGSAWAPGSDAGTTGSGSADQVAVFSGANTLASYPEMTFDGDVLSVGSVNIEASTQTLTAKEGVFQDSGASGSGAGGNVYVASYDGAAQASGDRLGGILFNGQTGLSGTAAGATIEAFADGAWSGTTSRANLRFATANTGSTTPTERLRITRSGVVELRNGANLDFYTAADVQAFEWDVADSVLYVFGYNAGAEISIQGKFSLLEGSIGLSGNVNNVYLPGDCAVLNIGSTGAYSISGIQPSAGSGKDRVLFVYNSSGFNVTLLDESVSSSAVNRFSLPSGDVSLLPDAMVALVYADGIERWKVLYSGTGGGGSYTNEEAQDAVGGILVDGNTIDFTYNDGTPSITAEAKTQMSITSDASGLRLSGDAGSPGNGQGYGTNSSGTKGWYNSAPLVYEYTTAQTNTTLNVPTGAVSCEIVVVGGGGGGGSGRRGAAGTVRCGGGGGSGGNVSIMTHSLSALGNPSSFTVDVGAGGAGGNAVTTDDTNGANGGAGGPSQVKNGSAVLAYAGPGNGGNGGTAANGTGGGTNGVGMYIASGGGNANTSGNTGSNSTAVANVAPSGGGAGGGVNVSNSASSGGGAGACWFSSLVAVSGGTAGNNGNNGGTFTGCPISNGGSGGGSSVSGVAGSGGAGIRGGGGGGGGASVNGNNSGAGGAAGPGYVRVTFYF